MGGITQWNDRALRQHLRPFQLGDLIEARSVSAGPVTSYDISTTRGRYLLRILCDRSAVAARFEEALLRRLVERGLTVPHMVDAAGHGFVVPTAPREQLSVFKPIPGRKVGVFEIRAEHVHQVGQFLASMHVATRGFRRRRQNRFDPQRIATAMERGVRLIRSSSHVRDLKVLAMELVRHRFSRELPCGTLHGDLLVDRGRFARGRLCAVVGFEAASTGPLVFDLAIAMADWAFWHDDFVPERARALVVGYESKRGLTPAERANLYELCRYAVTYFAIHRFCEHETHSRRGERKAYQDYRHFVRRLESLRALGSESFDGHVFGRRW